MGAEMKTAFGQVNVADGTETQKTPIMSFSEGNVYLGLKLFSYFDQKTNTRKEPVPKITASFNGKFVEVPPPNGKWWRRYADFIKKIADAMDGIDLSTANINDDVDYAKTAFQRFKTRLRQEDMTIIDLARIIPPEYRNSDAIKLKMCGIHIKYIVSNFIKKQRYNHEESHFIAYLDRFNNKLSCNYLCDFHKSDRPRP